MERYDIVYVVLVYKNTLIAKDFFKHLSQGSHRVIIVNSYFDNLSFDECRQIALTNNADFIPIENKGYGYGNNIGIQFAVDNYVFNYLIVSNSDIIIQNIAYLDSISINKAIIAPETRMLTGKRQNPDTPWKLPYLFEMTNLALKHNKPWLYFLTHIYTRLSREVFFLYTAIYKKEMYNIFSAHGSFFVVTEQAVKELHPLFDDNMFLYNEEWYLAMKAKYADVPIYYCPVLKVLHLEGASSDANNKVLFRYNQQSYSVLYNWIKMHKH